MQDFNWKDSKVETECNLAKSVIRKSTADDVTGSWKAASCPFPFQGWEVSEVAEGAEQQGFGHRGEAQVCRFVGWEQGQQGRET